MDISVIEYHTFGRSRYKSIISSRQDALTGTKHVAYVSRLRFRGNCFRTDFSIALNGNGTETTIFIFQCIWHT